MGVISLKVDFHCRVKKIRLRVAFHTCVYFIYAWKFYVR